MNRGEAWPPEERPQPVEELNWDGARARAFGERVLSLWQELLEQLPSLPVATRASEREVREAVSLPIPDEPLPVDDLMRHLRSVALEYSTYPGHPRFMGYVTGTGTVPGAAADLLAAALNQNVGAWRTAPAATAIELHLIQWFAQLFGLPQEALGLMVSGGAMANFVAMKAARDAAVGPQVRTQGLQGRPLAFYASQQAHDALERAADMLGLGASAVRRIPVDAAWRMRLDALEARLQEDQAASILPVAVIGTAGTTSTGAIDPLQDIARLCARHGIWFHVDGAYGALGMMASSLRPLYAGIERADSIAFDPHKWLYTPHSGGCVIVRNGQLLADAFSMHPTCLWQDQSCAPAGLDLFELGPQFSRGFQALKVWVSLLAHGRDAYARRIRHDVELAHYMAARLTKWPVFELMAPITLSVCSFRYAPRDLPMDSGREPYLNRLNERLLTALQRDGRVFCSNAVLGQRFALRACIVNFRTEAQDIDVLLEVAAELGERIDRELRPSHQALQVPRVLSALSLRDPTP